MAYRKNSTLPKGVRGALPPGAQTVYRKAFNNAEKQYKDPAKRTRGGDLAEVCSRVAWSAVKREYRKEGEKWVKA